MNQDVDVKHNLKNIVRGHLGRVASVLFVDKSLAMIDESADNKESFMAAAVRISRRVALFVDKDLAQTVYESLMTAIERIEAPRGTRRRYRRVDFFSKVHVKYDGEHHELESENLSEGGMYIKTRDPFPAGSELEITLPLEVGSNIHLTAIVVYKKDPFGETSKLPPGMAVEFKKVRNEHAEVLRSFIQRVTVQSTL